MEAGFAYTAYTIFHQAVILGELVGKWVNAIGPQNTTEKSSHINLPQK